MLTNVFIKLNIYTNNSLFIEALGADIGNNVLTEPLGLFQIIRKAIAIVLLVGGTQLGGPTWFFGTLYIIIIGHTVFFALANKIIKRRRISLLLYFAVLILVLVTVKVLTSKTIKIPLQSFVGRIFIGYYLFLLGTGIKRVYLSYSFDIKLIWKMAVAAISFVILLIMDKCTSVSIATASITSIWSFTLCSVTGALLVFTASSMAPEFLRSVLSYIGERTRPIVCLHMISFKIVTVVIIVASGLPMYMISSFPVLQNTTSWFWVLYTLVGIAVPLLFTGYIRMLGRKLLNQ